MVLRCVSDNSKKQVLSLENLVFWVAENASQNPLYLQSKCTTFCGFHPKLVHVHCKNKWFWDAFSATRKIKFYHWKTWYFELPKTHLKTLYIYSRNALLFVDSTQKLCIFIVKTKGFEMRFRQLEKASFIIGKLGILSCRKRISKPFIFTVEMHYFWAKSTKSSAFSLQI